MTQRPGTRSTAAAAATGAATRSSSARSRTAAPTRASLAYFSGTKGGKPYGPRKATLANGRKGRYNPLSCGGSCSPPSITWKERGVVYEIQADTTRAPAGADGQRRDQAGTAVEASRSAADEHRVEQAREARIDLVAAQRHVAVRALGARVRQPRLAQHLEVMRAGGLGDPELERAARALAARRPARARSRRASDRSARPSRRPASSRRRWALRGASFDDHRTKRASLPQACSRNIELRSPSSPR